MIRIDTRDFRPEYWHGIVSQFEDLNIMQLWEYGQAKTQLQGWKIARHLFWDGPRIVGAAQAMIKTIPILKKGIVWINRAPLWQQRGRSADPRVLREMLELLKRFWAHERGMYLRIAPSLQETPENRALMKEMGFTPVPDSQWVSALVDLRVSEEELMAQFRREWRRDLIRALEAGVSCRLETGENALAEFMEDHRDFLKRKHFFTNITPEFIQAFQTLLPPARKMPILLAYKGKERLGSLFVATYASVAEALGEGIRADTLALNAGKVLFWATMTEMKKRGFSFFDVGGAHPTKTKPGILKFKAGARGVQYALVGEFEVVQGLVARWIRLLLKIRGV